MTTERTEERKNRFNGESVMLTKEEARRHDCIFIAESLAEFHTDPDVKDKHYKIMREHLNWFMKHNANFQINVGFLSSHGWSANTSLIMDTICRGLGAIPCSTVQTELLLQMLWDHEVDVLPEDGGIGERYDDDPTDPTKPEGSWTSKLLGKVSAIKVQAMRRKLVQYSLTSILSHQAQRANIEVWCSDVVQSRVVSFLQKMRDRLEGSPRRYRDGQASAGQHSTRIPGILSIRELYCHLVHDFAAVVNASDKALGSEKNSVLTPEIRASLFETNIFIESILPKIFS